MDAALRAAENDFLGLYFARRPFAAGRLGVTWGRGQAPPVSQQATDDLRHGFRRVRSDLDRILSGAVASQDRLTAELMRELCQYEETALNTNTHRYVVSPLPEAGLSAQILVFLPAARLNSDADLEGFVSSCANVASALRHSSRELACGRRKGWLPVRILIERATGQVQRYLDTPLDDDPFLVACRQAGFTEASTLVKQLRDIITGEVRPAFRRYAQELKENVGPTGRLDAEAGLTWLPGGDDVYREAVRQHTTLDVDPHHLHAVGLDLVEGLRREAAALGSELGWPAEFDWIRDRLRRDEKLYFQTAQQMLDAARTATDRAAEATPRWITPLPTATLGVHEMAELEVSNGVIGRYDTAPLDRQGSACYWVNTADPRRCPVYEAAVLAHHEAIPGHHIEVSTSQEVVTDSAFRRLVEILPYSEGWALYMERFADQMGLYSDNVARLGMVSFQLWRASRLVVDTGIHALGWGRQEAITFLSQNTILTQRNVENEVNRYIAYPGSALGYMVGCLALKQLRAARVSEQSSPVQNRQFHSDLLHNGPLTLGLLGSTMGVEISV